mgnify:FL=1
MKRKFLAKAITLGLMLAVPFGVDAANYSPTETSYTEDGKVNLLYKFENGSASNISAFGINYIEQKYKYDNEEINDLTIIRTKGSGGFLTASYNPFNLTVGGNLTIKSFANLEKTWGPTLHIDNSDDAHERNMSLSANKVVLSNDKSQAINLVARKGGIKTNLDLNAVDSINISSEESGTINIGVVDGNQVEGEINLNITAGNNVTISAGKTAISSTFNKGVINIDAGNKLQISGNNTAVKNTGTLNLNQKNAGANTKSQIIISGLVENSGTVIGNAKTITLNSANTNGITNSGILTFIANDTMSITSGNGSAISNFKTVNLQAGESINLQGTSKTVSNTGNMSMQAKVIDVTATGKNFAVSNTGTLNINKTLGDLSGSKISFNNGVTNAGAITASAENIGINSSGISVALVNSTAAGNVSLNATNSLNITAADGNGINNSAVGGTVNLNAKSVNIEGNLKSIDNKGTLNINQSYTEDIDATTLNIKNRVSNAQGGTLKAQAGNIYITSEHQNEQSNNTVYTSENSSTELKATNGDIIISNKGNDKYCNIDQGVMANGQVNLVAENGKVVVDVYKRALQASADGNANIKAKEVYLIGGTHAVNAYRGGKITIDSEKIYLKAENGKEYDATYGDYELGINISSGSTVVLKNAKDVSIIGGISVKGDNVDANTGEVKVSGLDINASDNIYIQGTIKNVSEGVSSNQVTGGNINIGANNKDVTIKIDGDIYSGEYPGAIEKDESGTIVGDNGVAKASGGSINISLNNENSSLNGNIFDKDPGADATNGVHLEVKNGATWTTTGDSTVKEVKSNGGVIDLAGNDQNVNINNLTNGSGSGETPKATTIKTDSINNKLTIGENENKLEVEASSKVTDSMGNDIQDGMEKLLKNINVENGNKETTVTAAAGSVTGKTTITRDSDGNSGTATEDINKDNAGISEMASISLMAWRAENNDMNKRLGELRNSKGEHGIWTRMVRGQSKYGAQNVKNQYSTYQLGYDEKLSVDKHWTVGAAVSYTDASSSFTKGRGENKSTGFAVYGSYLSDNGSFVDLIAKAARLKNEFDVLGGAGKGDYETNGYSLSAEYGKRFTKDNGFWIEPQVELTYGYVGAVDYLTNNDVKVRQNGMDSLVGRIGFSMGRNIKAGNVYARASYLYDFDGETDVTFSKNSVTRGFKQDLGGGWWEVGVGTNINLSEATHLYFDVEKTYGGNVATPWQWNAGVRWSF